MIAGEVDAHVVLDTRNGDGDGAGGGEGGGVYAILDHRPLFEGHTLVLPEQHHETLADLPPDRLGPYFAEVQRVARAMEEVLGAVGSFVAMNNRVSQSVPHLHTHVVPRNRKDGLNGFFWPRTKYADDDAMAAMATRLREALESGRPGAATPGR
jgi:histidine triad (HIT) family protein